MFEHNTNNLYHMEEEEEGEQPENKVDQGSIATKTQNNSLHRRNTIDAKCPNIDGVNWIYNDKSAKYRSPLTPHPDFAYMDTSPFKGMDCFKTISDMQDAELERERLKLKHSPILLFNSLTGSNTSEKDHGNKSLFDKETVKSSALLHTPKGYGDVVVNKYNDVFITPSVKRSTSQRVILNRSKQLIDDAAASAADSCELSRVAVIRRTSSRKKTTISPYNTNKAIISKDSDERDVVMKQTVNDEQEEDEDDNKIMLDCDLFNMSTADYLLNKKRAARNSKSTMANFTEFKTLLLALKKGLASRTHSANGYYDMRQLEIMKILGEGTYGMVYEGYYKPRQRSCAIKISKSAETLSGATANSSSAAGGGDSCNNSLNSSSSSRNVTGASNASIREIALLLEMKHPNIVKLHDFYLSIEKCYLMMDLMECSLQHYMMCLRKSGRLIPEHEVKMFSYEILQGICFLHKRRVLHRDLKPENILMDSSSNVRKTLKISDFGLSRTFSIPLRDYNTHVVTLPYRAPELLMGASIYGPSIDVWSVGCIILEMVGLVNRLYLFPGRDHMCVMKEIFNYFTIPTANEWPDLRRLPHWEQISRCIKADSKTLWQMCIRRCLLTREFKSLINGVLKLNPNTRFNARDALRSEYFLEQCSSAYSTSASTTFSIYKAPIYGEEFSEKEVRVERLRRATILARGYNDAFRGMGKLALGVTTSMEPPHAEGEEAVRNFEYGEMTPPKDLIDSAKVTQLLETSNCVDENSCQSASMWSLQSCKTRNEASSKTGINNINNNNVVAVPSSSSITVLKKRSTSGMRSFYSFHGSTANSSYNSRRNHIINASRNISPDKANAKNIKLNRLLF